MPVFSESLRAWGFILPRTVCLAYHEIVRIGRGVVFLFKQSVTSITFVTGHTA